jgi:Tfp pilus assembly protein PilP
MHHRGKTILKEKKGKRFNFFSKEILFWFGLTLFFITFTGCGEPEVQTATVVPPPHVNSVGGEESGPVEEKNVMVASIPQEKKGGPPREVQAFEPPSYSYNPEGRRDPFSSILQIGQRKKGNLLPPLQRVELSQLQLIGIVWGGFGYSAMLQSSDGKGYTVQAGTLVGSKKGFVKEINPKTLVVQETFTDVFGDKKTRDFVFQLHSQEDFE